MTIFRYVKRLSSPSDYCCNPHPSSLSCYRPSFRCFLFFLRPGTVPGKIGFPLTSVEIQVCPLFHDCYLSYFLSLSHVLRHSTMLCNIPPLTTVYIRAGRLVHVSSRFYFAHPQIMHSRSVYQYCHLMNIHRISVCISFIRTLGTHNKQIIKLHHVTHTHSSGVSRVGLKRGFPKVANIRG